MLRGLVATMPASKARRASRARPRSKLMTDGRWCCPATCGPRACTRRCSRPSTGRPRSARPSRSWCTLPHGLTEVTGPRYAPTPVTAADADLTCGHAGEPLGERIILTGRVLDSDGRPVPDTLVEIWQANASGRYHHKVDDHPAPLDPNFDGGGRCLTDSRGPVPVHHDQAGGLPVGQPPQRVAAGAHSLLAVRPGVHPAAGHPDVLSRRPAVPVRPDLQLDPGRQGPGAADLRVGHGADQAGLGAGLQLGYRAARP